MPLFPKIHLQNLQPLFVPRSFLFLKLCFILLNLLCALAWNMSSFLGQHSSLLFAYVREDAKMSFGLKLPAYRRNVGSFTIKQSRGKDAC